MCCRLKVLVIHLQPDEISSITLYSLFTANVADDNGVITTPRAKTRDQDP